MFPSLFTALALAAGAPGLKDAPKPAPSVVGEWVAERRTFSGTETPPAGDALRYVFAADGTYAVHRGPRKVYADRKYATDPKKNPPTIDLDTEAVGGRVVRGIYKVDGDTLTVCWSNGSDPRPTAFESTAAKPTTLYVFKRLTRD